VLTDEYSERLKIDLKNVEILVSRSTKRGGEKESNLDLENIDKFIFNCRFYFQ